MCEFSLTPFLSLFSAFLPLSFTLRVWAFCCIYFSIPWSNDKDGGGEILWSAEQLLLEKPLSAFFKHLISVPHQDLLSVLESFFSFFMEASKLVISSERISPSFSLSQLYSSLPSSCFCPIHLLTYSLLGKNGKRNDWLVVCFSPKPE